MEVKFMILVIVLILIAGCTSQEPISKTYVIEDKDPNVFEIEEAGSLDWLKATEERRTELNEIRALREDKDNLEEFEFESTYKNVRRIIDDELVIGYVKELDNPDFKEVDE